MIKKRVRDTGKNITSDYYDEGYFTSDTKQYEEGGKLKSWGYQNPTGDWEPARDIAKIWKEMFNPSYVVDCAAGRGTFTKALRDEGVNAIAFDFSEFAVEHPCCNKEDIFRANVLDIPLEDNISDLTLVLDILEHIYASEIDTVLSEIRRISRKWVFFNIGGTVLPDQVKMLKRGEPIPEGYEGLVAAGHITFQTMDWWRNKLKTHGFILQDDKAKIFEEEVPNDYIKFWRILVALKSEEIFHSEYYDGEYFVGEKGGLTFLTPDGVTQHWSYYNKEGEWLGCKPVVAAIKKIMSPKNMLDVGCGRGTFTGYAINEGIDVMGIDFSKWAIAHPYPQAKGFVQLGDVRSIQFTDNSFDLVFASDICEHVYEGDIDKVISEFQRVSKKWIFYNISTVPTVKEELVLQKGENPSLKWQQTAVQGHVNVRQCETYWKKKVVSERWQLRNDLVETFRELVPKDVLGNWVCIIITENV